MDKLKIISVMAVVISAAVSMLIIMPDRTNTKADSETNTVGYMYTLKEYNGKVAVFDYGAKEPKEILNCPISNLPESEAANIIDGINVSDDYELQRLIEAYD